MGQMAAWKVGKQTEKKVYISFQYEIRFVRDKNNIQ